MLNASSSIARAAVLAWTIVVSIGAVGDAPDARATARAWLDELRLGPVLANAFRELGLDEGAAWTAVSRVRVLLALEPASATRFGGPAIRRLLEGWFANPDLRGFLGVNRHDGVTWFNKEAFEELLWWWQVLTAVDGPTAGLVPARRLSDRLLAAAAESSYRVDRLVELATLPRRAARPSSAAEPDGRRRRRGTSISAQARKR